MNSPVPILFTIPNFITAGSGRAMLNLIQRLDRDRFAPAVAVLRKGGKLDCEVERMGIPFIEAPFLISAKPYATLIPRALKAARIFRPYRFRVWHSVHYGEDYTEPLIAYSAGVHSWIYTKNNMSFGTRAWFTRSLLAKRIAAQNHDMLDRFFHSWLFRRRTVLIPRGVDTQRFCPGISPRLRLREELGIPVGNSIITCVAELLPVKGHPTLLQSVAGIPNVHLLLAGRALDTGYAGSLKEQAVNLKISDRVHFLGRVEDVPALLAETDLFVLPTHGRGRMEGCPVALLEAMACGKPCIATDIPGTHDLILHEESGLLVRPEDPTAMAEAIQRVLQTPQVGNSLGRSARCRVEEHYTIEREVSAHVHLYEEILGMGRA